jgi:hypothetical protein
MLHSAAQVLFESTDSPAVLNDPTNVDWLSVVHAVDGQSYELLARRYYIALYHLRKQRQRPDLPGTIFVEAQGIQQALQGMLDVVDERKANSKDGLTEGSAEVFVDAGPNKSDASLPDVLVDFSKLLPPLSSILAGPGRPPCDALCMMRAFLAAPLLGVGDDPTSVHKLLHSNPTFARACDFLGGDALKQTDELTSRKLPSLSVCEEFNEVMTRYGLWHLARLEQVHQNLESGVVEKEDTLVFDTTHLEANSHCANVVPLDAKVEEGKKPKHRKVPRMRKNCDCGKHKWESCEHPWSPTDQGVAVVVKGPTRIYWAHKSSLVSFGNSENPIDVRVLQYAAQADGKTLVPHLELLDRDFADVVAGVQYILVDDAYRENRDAVSRFGQQARLIVPVHGKKSKAELAAAFDGINRFTPAGVPICEAGHSFQMRGRDIRNERFSWAAPDGDQAQPVCKDCPMAGNCVKQGERRHIRVARKDFPQIDWDHPQHFARERARYQKRTGVERAIKRLKVDLSGENLTARDSHRVQAHLDRRLLILHLLLSAEAQEANIAHAA